MSLIDNFISSIRKSESMDHSPCYTLYVHHDEEEDITEDDILEPAAFQIPVEMKWRDLQDLICSEIGKAKAEKGFVYYDDENDEVRINSQEEYETALHICRKDKRDLHIYTLRPPVKRRSRQKKKRKPAEKRRPDDGFGFLQPGTRPQYQDDSEPFHPPTVTEEAERRDENPVPAVHEEPSAQPQGAMAAPPEATEGATAAPPPAYLEDETALISEEPTESEQETKPMPDVGNSIIRLIKKEVQEVIADELDDVWRFVNSLKRDMNRELDIIGDQLEAHSARLPQVQTNTQDDTYQPETSAAKSEQREPEESLPLDAKEEEESNYAATFICESLLDGSRVQTAETFEKHWVFRNDGNVNWDENTKLHLLSETCDPPVATGTSLSEWGAKRKSVVVPPLKQGESGVVCAEHTAPAHGCNYISSWRLSHKTDPFGPRVWCNVRVETESGTSVDDQKSMGSFEDIHPEGTSPKKSLERSQKQEESLHGSLVPEGKVNVEVKTSKADDALHNDSSIMSFNMTDISDGAKYIESHAHESAPYNPAVTSVEQPGEDKEPALASLEKKENAGASVDGEDHSQSSGSPVLVGSPEPKEEEEEEEKLLHEPEQYLEDELRTLENEDDSDEEGTDLYSSKYEEGTSAQAVEDVENFHEPPARPADSDDDDSCSEEQNEHEDNPELPRSQDLERQSSEDLHSVDYQLDEDDASMMSYASDFVVVPLPECFDVNKPLSESQYVVKKDTACDPMPQKHAATEPHASEPEPAPKDEVKEVVEEAETPPRYPPEVNSSDSETESEPPSLTLAMTYQSENSSIVSTTTPKTPVETTPSSKSMTPKVSLAPSFATPQNGAVADAQQPPPVEPQTPETPQPDSMDDSLTEKITKEFDEFLSNPKHPITRPSKPKVPMNQMPTSKPKTPVFNAEPKPVPASVLQMDDPYPLPTTSSQQPYFPPFEQGWRRNPLPIPANVINNDNDYWPIDEGSRPTPAPRHPSQVPRSEFTLAQDTQPTESALPSHPFAVASPSTSIVSPDPVPAPRRAPSPQQVPNAEYFFSAMGSDQLQDEENEPPEIFRTPPPSPPPQAEFELSALDQLYEMGFHDIDLNRHIYDQCEQDLNRTVQALVLRAEADQDMMA